MSDEPLDYEVEVIEELEARITELERRCAEWEEDYAVRARGENKAWAEVRNITAERDRFREDRDKRQEVIEELQAKVDRLTARGIEDMQARITELEAETNRVEARLVEQRALDMLCRHLKELRTALEEEKA